MKRSLCPLIAQVEQLTLSWLCPIPACRNEVPARGRPCKRDRRLFAEYLREVPSEP